MAARLPSLALRAKVSGRVLVDLGRARVARKPALVPGGRSRGGALYGRPEARPTFGGWLAVFAAADCADVEHPELVGQLAEKSLAVVEQVGFFLGPAGV